MSEPQAIILAALLAGLPLQPIEDALDLAEQFDTEETDENTSLLWFPCETHRFVE